MTSLYESILRAPKVDPAAKAAADRAYAVDRYQEFFEFNGVVHFVPLNKEGAYHPWSMPIVLDLEDFNKFSKEDLLYGLEEKTDGYYLKGKTLIRLISGIKGKHVCQLDRTAWNHRRNNIGLVKDRWDLDPSSPEYFNGPSVFKTVVDGREFKMNYFDWVLGGFDKFKLQVRHKRICFGTKKVETWLGDLRLIKASSDYESGDRDHSKGKPSKREVVSFAHKNGDDWDFSVNNTDIRTDWIPSILEQRKAEAKAKALLKKYEDIDYPMIYIHVPEDPDPTRHRKKKGPWLDVNLDTLFSLVFWKWDRIKWIFEGVVDGYDPEEAKKPVSLQVPKRFQETHQQRVQAWELINKQDCFKDLFMDLYKDHVG